MFLAVVRRRDRHRRAPGGANVDGLQAVAPHPPGQVAHEGARRVANRGGAHRALQHGGEEGAEELVRDGPQLLFALLRFLCRPGRSSTRLKLQRPPEGSAQVDGNVAKIDLAARGVDGALVHFNAPSWAVRAAMSSTTLPVCPKTGSTSPSLTVHLCLHTVPGNRECALWELAHDLHPYESLVQERGARPGLRTPATRPVDPYQAGGGVAGQHRRQGPSRRHGGSKKNGPQAIGKSRGGWTTKIHLVAADARTALTFALSPGQAHDSPEGRKLLASMGPQDDNVALVMDRAYQGDETRQLALDLGFTPVVPPLKTRTDPWEYDREMYKRRNEVERLFRRLKGYRRIFSRFEKLDVMFIGFIHFVLIFDALR